jgi:hypothetical protein
VWKRRQHSQQRRHPAPLLFLLLQGEIPPPPKASLGPSLWLAIDDSSALSQPFFDEWGAKSPLTGFLASF